MLKVDRSQVDKAIEEMDMFTATKEVLEQYETEKQVLVDREEDFNKKVSDLQERHVQTLGDRELAKGNTSEYIHLSKELTQIDEEMNIVLSLQEQLKEDYRELKQKYVPIIRSSYGKDLSAKSQFNVNETVDYVKYELIKSIADYASEVSKQQRPLMDVIGSDFLDDKELMTENRGFRRTFDFTSTNLSYSGDISQSVIHKNHIASAVSGNLHPEIRKPKEVK